MDQKQHILIITGLSGSGKSTALAAFEDAGFYCVDNMPIALLPGFLKLPIEKESSRTGFAFVMDLREPNFLTSYKQVLDDLKREGYTFSILFLEADDRILLQRYSQTRRFHPLANGHSLLEGIRAEKRQMEEIKKAADNVINTSHYNVHELKKCVFGMAKKMIQLRSMRLNIMSFGFKYGAPPEADLVIDVRFLSNPYFVPELKALTGEDEAVKSYVRNNPQARQFLTKYTDLLDYLIPLYEKEGKAYLTIAVGCTGGRHRSVVIAREIYDHISTRVTHIELTHRDIGR
jgi:UPF0042 nucleotide-binding protein